MIITHDLYPEEEMRFFMGHRPGTVHARCVGCGKPFTFHSQYPKFDMQKKHACSECQDKSIREAIKAAGLDKIAWEGVSGDVDSDARKDVARSKERER